MASVPKTLRIVASEESVSGTRLVCIEQADGAPFQAFGGKYIIVNTGVPLAEGKSAKRAYSLVPVDGQPGRAVLAVKRLGAGPGSNALHAALPGTELSFSGPWGKLLPEGGLGARTLFVATDTGITSALGVAEQSAVSERAPEGPALEVLWLREEGETFFGLKRAQRRIEAAGARFAHAEIPPALSPSRAAVAFGLIEARIREHRPAILLGAGDGAIVHPLRARFPEETHGVVDARIECFFHNPERKSV